MDLTVTLTALLAAVGVAVFCGWRGALPPDLGRGPRLVPWRAIMMLTACVVLVLLVHLVNLLGVQTGRAPPAR